MVTISMFDQIKPNYLKSYAETHFNKEVELKHFLLTFICIRSGSRYGTQGPGSASGPPTLLFDHHNVFPISVKMKPSLRQQTDKQKY